MVKRIVKKFHPQQVILFGSALRARRLSPGRDKVVVDLLVAMDFDIAHDKGLEIRQALYDLLVPLDVIVTRPEDFAWRKEVVGIGSSGCGCMRREGVCIPSTPKAVITVIREWLAKADNDLTTAAHTLTLGED